MAFLEKFGKALKNNKFRLGIIGIIYVISPIDFLPEIILGPVGYMDDIAVLFVSLYYLEEGWIEANG